jgi:hypothetical protein
VKLVCYGIVAEQQKTRLLEISAVICITSVFVLCR